MFYLGTHHPAWLGRDAFRDVPLFVSRRTLAPMRRLPRAVGSWVLDSGGFTELSMLGAWELRPTEYARIVRRCADEVGGMRWAAPQDWMCEPWICERTGRDVAEHQRLTVENLLELRAIAPDLPIVPVLQGWTVSDYLRCIDLYAKAGIELEREPIVGIGTVCRRQGTSDAEAIVRRVADAGIRIHAFGVKTTGLVRYRDAVVSADSMAWSFNARKNPPLPGCRHKACSGCQIYALRWYDRLAATLEERSSKQLSLWSPAGAGVKMKE